MKLKILITPLALVIMIIVVIWGIVPAYSDYIQKRDNLADDKMKLEDVQGKQKNVENLLQELGSSTQQQNVIIKYLPAEKQEADVFGNLNNIASQEGLSVYAMSVADESGKAVTKEVDSDVHANGNNDFMVTVGVAGEYQKIKNFLAKVSALKRFNEIKSLEISAADNEEESETGKLKAELDMNFSYLEKVDSIPNFSNSIFLTGKFDMSAIEAIQEKTTTDLSAISANVSEKSNPFLP